MSFQGDLGDRELWYSRTSSRIAGYESLDGPDATRTFLDQEIASLQGLIELANRRRNLLIVISRLLPELLGEIFRIVHDEDPPSRNVGRKPRVVPRFNLGWIRLTHVCQRWRQIALEHSSLWSTVVLSSMSSSWAQEMLLRSRDAPLSLTLEIDLDSEINDDITSLLDSIIGQHHRRIKYLSVETALEETLQSLTAKPMPRLEYLSIAMSESQPEALQLPDHFLLPENPRLTNLTLSRCFFPWNSPAYRNLLHLDLQNLAPSSSPSFTQLDEMFARMTCVRTLKFADIFSHISAPLEPRHHTPASLHLPQTLEFLYWEENAFVFLDIVRYFVIAPTTAVELAVPLDLNPMLTDIDFSSTIADIISHIWARYPHPPETMQIRSINKGGYTDSLLALRRRKVPLTCACTDDWTGVPPYDFMIRWHAPAPVKTTEKTVCGVRADGLHDLALGIDAENMTALGSGLLPLATNVRKLRTFDCALLSSLPLLKENLRAVREARDSADSSSSQRVLLPNLESICIIGDTWDLNTDDVVDICEYLRTRKELGYGVEELHIPQSYFEDEGMMTRFRGEVSHLRCQRYNT